MYESTDILLVLGLEKEVQESFVGISRNCQRSLLQMFQKPYLNFTGLSSKWWHPISLPEGFPWLPEYILAPTGQAISAKALMSSENSPQIMSCYRSWWTNTPVPSLLQRDNFEAYGIQSFSSETGLQVPTDISDLILLPSLSLSCSPSPLPMFPLSPTYLLVFSSTCSRFTVCFLGNPNQDTFVLKQQSTSFCQVNRCLSNTNSLPSITCRERDVPSEFSRLTLVKADLEVQQATISHIAHWHIKGCEKLSNKEINLFLFILVFIKLFR